MALTHTTDVRNALADEIDDQVNTGTSDSQGDFVILDGSTVLVTIPLEDPAFGSASGGTITLAGTPHSATASASGTADGFEVQNRDNDEIFSGTVTGDGGGGDVELDNTSINSGQTVEISSFTYTASD